MNLARPMLLRRQSSFLRLDTTLCYIHTYVGTWNVAKRYVLAITQCATSVNKMYSLACPATHTSFSPATLRRCARKLFFTVRSPLTKTQWYRSTTPLPFIVSHESSLTKSKRWPTGPSFSPALSTRCARKLVSLLPQQRHSDPGIETLPLIVWFL